MEKLQISYRHLLLVLIILNWISFSAQRPQAQSADDAQDNIMAAMLMADYDYPATQRQPAPRQDENAENDGDGGDGGDVFETKSRLGRLETLQMQHRKRGFSMLTRWKPFNSLSKQRTSIRNINRALLSPAAAAANDFEMVSAETRAFSRPSGQPLRWG